MTKFTLDIAGHALYSGEIQLPVPEPPPPPPADYSMYRRVLHDFEVFGVYPGEKQRIRLPETVKTYDDHFVSLDRDWQWYWFRLLVHSFTSYQTWDERALTGIELAYLKNAWRSLTLSSRALTNNYGSDNCRDYISDTNKDAEDMRIETLDMGGNVEHVIAGHNITKSGIEYTQIEMLPGPTIGAYVPPPNIAEVNRKTRPDLIHVCTNVSANPQIIDPFPQLGGKDVPYPFVSKRTNFMRVTRLKEISVYPPRPYYP